MAPAISGLEIRLISSSSQSARSLLSTPLPAKRHSHHSIFRHISFAHKRRFQHPRYPENSPPIVPADNPPLPYKPTTDLPPSVFPLADRLATSTMASDLALSESALLQLQAARNRATATTAALIAVCVVLGLTACTVMGRLAYRGRFSLFRCLRRHRQAEDDLGFVFIQYDDSTWVTPAKEVPKEMPSFETGPRETEGGEGRQRLVPPGPFIPKVEVNPMPIIPPLVVETSPDTSRSRSPPHPQGAESGLCGELTATVKADGQDPDEAALTNSGDLDSCSQLRRRTTLEKLKMSNALGLVVECDDNVDFSTLASPQLAAAFARRASEVDDAIGETEFTIIDSPASDAAACGLSTKSSGSEEDYELHRVETHNVNFKRGVVVSLETSPDVDCDEDKKSPLDLYNLPRVVISASSSVASEVFSSRSNRVSGMSEATIDLGDFPRPPFINDVLTSTTTSLISEIEDSLGSVIGGNLGMTGRRASSAPQLTG